MLLKGRKLARILFGLGAVLIAAVMGCGSRGVADPAPAGDRVTKVEVTENGVRLEVKRADGKGGERGSEGDQRIPDTWTHQDLAAFLAKKGVKVEVLTGYPGFSYPDQPASIFSDPTEPSVAEVLVLLCKDYHVAKEQAGSLGEAGFAKGRFALGPIHNANGEQKSRNEKFLSRIKAALE